MKGLLNVQNHITKMVNAFWEKQLFIPVRVTISLRLFKVVTIA